MNPGGNIHDVLDVLLEKLETEVFENGNSDVKAAATISTLTLGYRMETVLSVTLTITEEEGAEGEGEDDDG